MPFNGHNFLKKIEPLQQKDFRSEKICVKIHIKIIQWREYKYAGKDVESI